MLEIKILHHEQQEVRIKYFVPDEHKSGGAIIEVSGKVKKISVTDATITLADGCKIRLSDIVDLSIGWFAYLQILIIFVFFRL